MIVEALTVQRVIDAPLEDVWLIAGDFLKSPGPSVVISTVKQGDPERNGTGAERIARILGFSARERLDVVIPFSHFTYTVLSGPPTKNHTGRVEFARIRGATLIKWSATLSPKIPGSGWISRILVRKVLNTYIDAVEQHLKLRAT